MSSVNRTIQRAVKITPSDSDKVSKVSDGIQVNEDGVVRLKLRKGSGTTDLFLLAGVSYAFEVEQVHDTGTEIEGDIHLLYYE